ncbi:MAG TPA: 4-(cytidine 5'-diphospho)-2-C-methyl-D-erythritol kinase [Candidatus Copromorpha excrementigallinarum]|uniref:4-diphosphocytidyl-2-C-methyl-D-erythritol kinase n=1 Tax=Candidatus Allocopromorpha excrementigallinarum TaxID=2840742 RepID=A0A9D1I1V6_9FIRM|nr:4-(cytidine 5'-diphospho)-2-C-methyl-D-erythritol kinase [Candidatus Copromorpha excrementigallinarum]
MKKTEIKAFAKINLSLDVKALLDNGFHQVEMIMQQISLCDRVLVRWYEDLSKAPSHVEVELSTSKFFLPTDRRNLAYKAALLMYEVSGKRPKGKVRIDIKKNIPVAAGLAGGSSDGAAVIHALNLLWELRLPLEELCSIGARLGSDVPFCVMGQARGNPFLKKVFHGDPLASSCALAAGTGTDMTPLPPLKAPLVLSKPPVSVSTAEVYRGIDHVEIPIRPDNEELIHGLSKNNLKIIEKNMINVLENFTLKSYPNVMYTKNKMQDLCSPHRVLMSGSGPTVFGICDTAADAKRVRDIMREVNRESFWSETIL